MIETKNPLAPQYPIALLSLDFVLELVITWAQRCPIPKPATLRGRHSHIQKGDEKMSDPQLGLQLLVTIGLFVIVVAILVATVKRSNYAKDLYLLLKYCLAILSCYLVLQQFQIVSGYIPAWNPKTWVPIMFVSFVLGTLFQLPSRNKAVPEKG